MQSKYVENYLQTASASGLRPPDHIPGFRPKTPTGTSPKSQSHGPQMKIPCVATGRRDTDTYGEGPLDFPISVKCLLLHTCRFYYVVGT